MLLGPIILAIIYLKVSCLESERNWRWILLSYRFSNAHYRGSKYHDTYFLPYQMFSTVKKCIHTKFGWIWSSELSASNKFSFKSVKNWNFVGPQKASKQAKTNLCNFNILDVSCLSGKNLPILKTQKKFELSGCQRFRPIQNVISFFLFWSFLRTRKISILDWFKTKFVARALVTGPNSAKFGVNASFDSRKHLIW